jgi:signal transduction histidine kinase
VVKITSVEKHGFVRIKIENEGCGSENVINEKGLGLGLTLCKEFMELNKGELIINSSEKGSEVVVSLPLN